VVPPREVSDQWLQKKIGVQKVQDTRGMLISISTDGDDSELDELRIELSDELSLLPISEITAVSAGDAPENARAVEALAIGKLIVKFGPQAVNAVSTAIRAWLRRSTARSVELKIDNDSITLNKVSAEDQKRLLDLFIQRHFSAEDID
jgi:hypothetical protein